MYLTENGDIVEETWIDAFLKGNKRVEAVIMWMVFVTIFLTFFHK